MKSSYFLVARELNREGIHYLSQKKLPAAISSFRQALSVIKDFCESSGSGDSNCICPLGQQHCGFDDRNWLEVTSSSGDYFICELPLSVPGYFAPESAPQHSAMLAYVAVYNLALSHHISAGQEQNSRRKLKHLQIAASMYGMAQSLCGTQQAHVTTLQKMALFNNHAVVLVSLDETSRAEECFRTLMSNWTVDIVGVSGQHSDKQLLEGFLCNAVSMVILPRQSAAAA